MTLRLAPSWWRSRSAGVVSRLSGLRPLPDANAVRVLTKGWSPGTFPAVIAALANKFPFMQGFVNSNLSWRNANVPNR